jgi:glycosyltransferase involved in cell wall biosynthesis
MARKRWVGNIAMNETSVIFEDFSLENYTMGLTKALTRSGAKVVLFTTRRSPSHLAHLFRVHGTNLKIAPRTTMKLDRLQKFCEERIVRPNFRRRVGRIRPDVFHTNSGLHSLAFFGVRQDYEAPLIHTAHYALEPEPFPQLVPQSDKIYQETAAIVLRFLSGRFCRIVTVSEFARKRLEEIHGIRSTMIYHGVDRNEFSPNAPKIPRRSISVANQEEIVLWVGRFGHYPYKDPFTFIRAIPPVLRECPQTKFIMIGKGYLKGLAMKLASKLGLGKQLRFMDRVRKLNSFYATSGIFVSSSFNDTFGLVVAEAMACGKPTIVSDSGAPKEIIGDAGLIFNYGSHLDLTEKITQLIRDPDLRLKLSLKARERIVQNFSWERAAQNYIDAYRKGR